MNLKKLLQKGILPLATLLVAGTLSVSCSKDNEAFRPTPEARPAEPKVPPVKKTIGAATHKIVVNTEKGPGEKVKLLIYARETERSDVFIDWNNNGTYDEDTDDLVTKFERDYTKGASYTEYELKGRDFAVCGKVIRFAIMDEKIKGVDLSGNTLVKALALAGTKTLTLTGLDLSRQTDLRELLLQSVVLPSLNVSQNTALEKLVISKTPLTNINLNNNVKLKVLSLNSNKFTSLDVSKNVALEVFACAGNQLTSLDVTKNVALQQFACTRNKIRTLDVTKNTELVLLYVGVNSLTTLDISKNTKVKDFDAGSNQLTSLDFSRLTQLEEVQVSDNRLTALDFRSNPNMKLVACSLNRISSAAYTQLINGLKVNTEGLILVFSEAANEQNEISDAQVTKLRSEKKWKVFKQKADGTIMQTTAGNQ